MVSKIWPSGTLWATAMTPVIVSVVKEALERPAQKITQVSAVGRYEHDPDELLVEEIEPDGELSERKLYGAGGHKWRIAIVTGLLAFVIGALVLTIPELVAGRSIVHGDRPTTIIPHKPRRHAKQKIETKTVTTTVPAQTQTTTTPAQTETTPTQTETTPTQTETTPAPQTTTVPPATTTQPAP